MRVLRRSRQEGSWGKDPEVPTLQFCPLPGSSQPEAEVWTNEQQDRTFQLTTSEAQIFAKTRGLPDMLAGLGKASVWSLSLWGQVIQRREKPLEGVSLTPFSLSYLYMSISHP